VQTAGYLIAAAAKFTAGMEHGKDYLQRRFPGLGLDTRGNAASVILNGNNIAFPNFYLDMITIPSQRFINGVVYNLIDQMVQSCCGLRTNIHTRALSDCFQSLQHLNLIGAVCLLYFF